MIDCNGMALDLGVLTVKYMYARKAKVGYMYELVLCWYGFKTTLSMKPARDGSARVRRIFGTGSVR